MKMSVSMRINNTGTFEKSHSGNNNNKNKHGKYSVMRELRELFNTWVSLLGGGPL